MKKLLVIGLAALLVVAFAAPSMAEMSKFSFRGDYRIQWRYWNNLNLADDSDMEGKQSYIRHRWRLYTDIMPTDQLVMHADFILRDAVWGSAQRNVYYGNAAGLNVGAVELAAVYMDIKTSIGMFRLGRQWVGPGGLIGIGWIGSDFAPSQVFDGFATGDRMMHIYTSGPFSLFTGWDKGVEADAFNGLYDSDFDDYFIVPVYRGKNWAVTGSYVYFAMHHLEPMTRDWHRVNPAVVANFGPIGIHGEGIWVFAGKQKIPGTDDVDLSGWGIYADVTYNYGPGTVCLQYFYISGDDLDDADKIKNLQASGTEFVPFMIATDIGLNYAIPAAAGAIGRTRNTLQGGLNNQSNWQMIGVWLDHSITENMILHAAVGYFTVNEAGRNAAGEDVDNHYGTEINLGFRINFMKNLSNEIMVGYFMPGSYFEFGVDGIDLGAAYAAQNTLTLKY